MFIVMNFKNVIFKPFFIYILQSLKPSTKLYTRTVLSGSRGHLLEFSLVMKPVSPQAQNEEATFIIWAK